MFQKLLYKLLTTLFVVSDCAPPIKKSFLHLCRKDTGHSIHPAGDASEHVSLVREILLCGYCNAAGEGREMESMKQILWLTSSPEYTLQFISEIIPDSIFCQSIGAVE